MRYEYRWLQPEIQTIGWPSTLRMNLPQTHSKDTYMQKHARTFGFIKELDYVEEVKTPILSRRIRFSTETRDTKKFNWLIQSSCVDLLLVALEHVLTSNKVELRAHIHDSLYLACLCEGPHPNCKQAQEVVQELENLYSFFWPNSKVRVFKFGEIEWVERS